MIDISTINQFGDRVEQSMGSSDGYAEYLKAYSEAKDKPTFNAHYFGSNQYEILQKINSKV